MKVCGYRLKHRLQVCVGRSAACDSTTCATAVSGAPDSGVAAGGSVSVNLYVCTCRSESDDDEIDDKELNNILIVTQTPPYAKKHPQGDRHPNPDYLPRAKMSAEIAKVINDGLCYYEEELWTEYEVVVFPLSYHLLSLLVCSEWVIPLFVLTCLLFLHDRCQGHRYVWCFC